MFYLCTGTELYGSGGEDDTGLGARTKTKARARAAQEAVDAAMEEGVWAADEDARDSASGSLDDSDHEEMEEEEMEGGFEEVAEEMVVRRRRAVKKTTKATTTPPEEDVLSFGWKGMDLGKMNINPLMARVLGQRAEAAEAEADQDETEIDFLMLLSMAEFPGYEPVTESEREHVMETYGGRGCPPRAPPGRETLPAFIYRKLTPRQPPGFAAFVAACLSRHPEDRPTAAEALNWPGAWSEEP